MKRILFLGVLIFFVISGTGFAMGPAIGGIMKGTGMMGGQKNNDTMESETKHTHVDKKSKDSANEDREQTHGSSLMKKDDASTNKN